jgi:hypothetical protein
MNREIHQREDGEHEEKKRSTADQNPKQGAGTSVRHVGKCSTWASIWDVWPDGR